MHNKFDYIFSDQTDGSTVSINQVIIQKGIAMFTRFQTPQVRIFLLFIFCFLFSNFTIASGTKLENTKTHHSDKIDKVDLCSKKDLTDYSDATGVQISKVRSLLEMGEAAKAKSEIRKIFNGSNEASSGQLKETLELTNLANRSGRYDITELICHRLIELDSDYAKNGELLNILGNAYRGMRYYGKAMKYYQKAIDTSDKNAQLQGMSLIARLAIVMPDEIAAPDTSEPNDLNLEIGLAPIVNPIDLVDVMIQKYPNNNLLGHEVFMVGEEYYLKGQKLRKQKEIAKATDAFTKAIAIWEKNCTSIPNQECQANANYYSAVSLMTLGDYVSAINYYQKVVKDFPEYKGAWNAQYQIACCYSKLLKDGQASAEQVVSAYQLLLKNYPDCPAVGIAIAKLKNINQF